VPGEIFVTGIYYGWDLIVARYDGITWSLAFRQSTTDWEEPRIWGSSANDIYVVAKNTYAVVDALTIFHYDGASWTNISRSVYSGLDIEYGEFWGDSPDAKDCGGIWRSRAHWRNLLSV
jgi:hypothetical protein